MTFQKILQSEMLYFVHVVDEKDIAYKKYWSKEYIGEV